MSLDGGEDNLQPMPKMKMRPQGVAGLAVLAGLLTAAVLLPFAFRGELSVERPHTGVIACWTHAPTKLSVYYYDFGNWLWLHSSPPVQSVALDNPELAVVSYEAVVMDQELFRQRIALIMDVVARSPGQHEVSGVTIKRGSLVDIIPLDALVFAAREVAGEVALSDLSSWIITGAPASGEEGLSGGFWISSEKDTPLEVTVYAGGLPQFVTFQPVTIRLSARETSFVRMAVGVERMQSPAYLLFRPWLEIRSGSQEFAGQPGPLMVIPDS